MPSVLNTPYMAPLRKLGTRLKFLSESTTEHCLITVFRTVCTFLLKCGNQHLYLRKFNDTGVEEGGVFVF